MNILFIQLHLWSTEYWSEIFFNRLFSFWKTKILVLNDVFYFFRSKKLKSEIKKQKKRHQNPESVFEK